MGRHWLAPKAFRAHNPDGPYIDAENSVALAKRENPLATRRFAYRDWPAP